MKVTSDSLFHFTPSLKNLSNILQKKFGLTYCREKYILNYQAHDNYFPMISFCDIPLSLAKDQIKKYGSYAIGMTKDWGIKNKLNPVVYVEENSLLAKDIQEDLDRLLDIMKVVHKRNKKFVDDLLKVQSEFDVVKNKIKNRELEGLVDTLNEIPKILENPILEFTDTKEMFKHLKAVIYSKMNLFRYIKNYRGSLVRRKKTFTNYRFYDEREWRYVPAFTDKRVEPKLSEEGFMKYRGKSLVKPLIANIILDFTAEDIKFLLVKSSSDIPKLIKLIHKTNDLAKNHDDIDILTTKILTKDQLNTDF
jgi:hypothetical protein